MQESIESVQLRIGNHDEGGLTKALDNVFPTAQRLLCTKHIKDNVSDHLKNSIGVKDTERSEILDSIFVQSGLVDSTDRNDFECKAADISTKYPSFSDYFHTKKKEPTLSICGFFYQGFSYNMKVCGQTTTASR